MNMKPTIDYALSADSAVVTSWVEGWALSRGVAAPVQVCGGFRVDVGLPDQQARYVFAKPSSAIEKLSQEIVEPNILIKVFTSPEALEPLLADGWSIESVGFLMTTYDLHGTGSRHRTDYQYGVETVPGGYVAGAYAPNGEVVASGRAFLAGSTAVFDQISTHPDHRRRGLGGSIMGELGAAALRGGATKGALVATPDGRALYSTLGWRLHALITTAVRNGDASP